MDMDFFDLFKQADEGENEQETADPAQEAEDEETQGENGQEIADPAGEPGEGEQTPQQRRENAARRRRLETEAAISAAREDEQRKAAQREAELIKSLGIRNPYDGNKLIETREAYDEYVQKRDAKALERELASGRLSPETLDRVIDRKIAQREKPVPEQPEVQPEDAPNMAELQRQYDMLKEIAPDAPTLDELGANPDFIKAMEDTGHLVRAYQKVSAAAQTDSAKARAVAQERQRNTGKDHLRGTASKGADAVVVTADMRRAYKMLHPGITDAEIRNYEAKSRK